MIEEPIGLWPSQYKTFKILKEAEKPLTEKEIREKWNVNSVSYTSSERKSPVYQELKALEELNLIIKEKKGKTFQYRIKPKKIAFAKYNPSQFQIKLVQYILEHGPTTRKVFVKELKTARTTIYDNLFKLLLQNIVEKFSRNEGKRGRPIIYWRIKDLKEF